MSYGSTGRTEISYRILRSLVGVMHYIFFISIKGNTIWIKRITIQLKQIAISIKQNTNSLKRIAISIKQNTILIKRNTISLKQIAFSIKQITISLKRIAISIKRNTISLKQFSISLYRNSLRFCFTELHATSFAHLVYHYIICGSIFSENRFPTSKRRPLGLWYNI